MTSALRYAAAIRDVVSRAGRMHTGAGILLTSPGEQRAVAEAIRAALPFDAASLADVTALRHEPFRRIVVGLGPAGRERTEQLGLLNSRRGWFSTHDQRVILVVDLVEMLEVQRHAADLFSARPFFTKVPFVPDAAVDIAAARAELAASLGDRFGKLDMRGLIRRESQDVAFSIEDLHQDLSGQRLPSIPTRAPLRDVDGADAEPADLETPSLEPGLAGLEEGTAPVERKPLRALLKGVGRPLVDWATAALETPHRTLVVLGGPGSGKTFFLRWLALQAARRETFVGVEGPLPLLVSIAAFARAPEPVSLTEHVVDELLRNGLAAAHVAESALRGGRALVLLDGLDEVPGGGHRARVLEEIRALRQAFPDCLFVITSRPAGSSGLTDLERWEVETQPFEDDQIRGFLRAWSALYARERLGAGKAAARAGEEEGERLVSEVLSNPGVKALARTPLLLTVIAVVHRTGVRLPDHRVELYDQITQVLVEKWNRVRGLSAEHGAAPLPLEAVDAVRLLGPLALRMVSSGVQSNIPEETLRRDIAAALEAGHLRGLATVDEVVELFRDTLGLLVEVGPGLFSFLHLTLAEYFAAWELVRSDALEKLVSDPKQAFLPQHREVLLLAVGVLGLLRGDDQRLAGVVEKVAASADAWTGEPTEHVPALLVGLLEDDANLGTGSVERLLSALVPAWWVQRFDEAFCAAAVAQDEGHSSPDLVGARFQQAQSIAFVSVFPGRPSLFLDKLRARLRDHYGPGGRGPFPRSHEAAQTLLSLLGVSRIDGSEVANRFFAEHPRGQALGMAWGIGEPHWDGVTLRGDIYLPKGFAERASATDRSFDLRMAAVLTQGKQVRKVALPLDRLSARSVGPMLEAAAFELPLPGEPGEELRGVWVELVGRGAARKTG